MALALLLGLAAGAQAQEDPVSDAQDTAEQVEQVRQAEAIAQDPGPACQEQTQVVSPGQGAPGCDTEYTPIAKDGLKIGWTMVSGDVFPGANPGDYNPNPPDDPEDPGENRTGSGVDFFAVDFSGELHGLAGGAACKEPVPTGTDLEDHLATCTRVPVIWRFALDARGIASWKEIYRGEDRGYVGAIAWLTENTALAVGGSGCYPRREVREALEQAGHCPDANPGTDADPLAGSGLAWYSQDVTGSGRFDPVPFGDAAPDDVTGLTALDSTFGLAESRPGIECEASEECAFAGGLKQIWVWKDGQFVDDPFEPGDDDPNHNDFNDPDPVEGGADWLYRVRAILFSPDPLKANAISAYAVTSGCCAELGSTGELDPTKMYSSRLRFDPVDRSWTVGAVNILGSSDGAGAMNRTVLPESLYAITYRGTNARSSVLATPAGPIRPGEPGSYIYTMLTNNDTPTVPLGATLDLALGAGSGQGDGFLAATTLTAARLVDGDGDFQGHRQNVTQHPNDAKPPEPDDVMDWAVGDLRTTRQAVAYTTTTRSYGGPAPEAPYPLDCPQGGVAGPLLNTQLPLECQPDTEPTDQLPSETLYRLPAYSLNGFTMLSDGTGIGWAVGDRGALLRLGGEGASATLPPENRAALGARRREAAPDRGLYEQSTPGLTDEPGTVPALATRPTLPTASPQLSAYGSPVPAEVGEVPPTAGAFAMSRDGREGWAVGPPGGNSPTTLYRFDGARWTACRFHAIRGILPADPACAALRPLRDFEVTGVDITAIGRIPLENDSDPSNDDEFEAIAAATPAKAVTGAPGAGSSVGQTILRYRDGAWAVDEATLEANPPGSNSPLFDQEITEIAFSDPDHGWMVGAGRAIYHFDSDEWTRCTASEGRSHGNQIDDATRLACEDPGEDTDPADLRSAQGTPANENQGHFPANDPAPGTITHLALAGERVYLYATRGAAPSISCNGIPACGAESTRTPLILYNDPGRCEAEGDEGCWQQALDPKNGVGEDIEGTVVSLSVAADLDGYSGWALGSFVPGGSGGRAVKDAMDMGAAANPKLQDRPGETPFLRTADRGGLAWTTESATGAARDYQLERTAAERPLQERPFGTIVAVRAPGGARSAIALSGRERPPLWWNPADRRWEVFPTPWVSIDAPTHRRVEEGAIVQGAGADGAGGLWLSVEATIGLDNYLYRYSPEVPGPLFEDTPHPIREGLTAAAAGGDGSFWVATESNAVYRYDRVTGWDRMTVPGWDPGRVVTNASDAHAIAIGPDGEAIVVGEGGRIARVGPGGALLDRAAGVLCSRGREAPCGTGRDLRAVAIAPDGSALAGGDYLSLLFRPPGGEFRTIDPPPLPAAAFATIGSISMPTPERAWLTLDTGYVFAGTRQGERWSWRAEALGAQGKSIAREAESGRVVPLNAIAIDPSGHGYAVGDDGAILERSDGAWRLLDSGYRDDLISVALAPAGDGALIGADTGAVLTRAGRGFAPARAADLYGPLATIAAGEGIVGLAIVPGLQAGEVEAWAASQAPRSPTVRGGAHPPDAPGAILHYSSDPSDPLFDGGAESSGALTDSPPRSPAELSFAAFGRSDCQNSGKGGEGGNILLCPELTGSNKANDVIATRVRDEILAAEPAAPDFALFSGDVGDYAGSFSPSLTHTGLAPSALHNRWVERIADPLADAGVPVFAATGRRDLSRVEVCVGDAFRTGVPCVGKPQQVDSALNLAWRQAMAQMPEPWGAPETAAEATSAGGLEFAPVHESGIAVELGDVGVEDPTHVVPGADIEPVQVPDELRNPVNEAIPDELTPGFSPHGADPVPEKTPGAHKAGGSKEVGDLTVPTGGARTHYAFDVERDGETMLRVVVVDTSLRSLAASDVIQNPVEEQLTWLEDVLGSRPAGAGGEPVRTVVVSNTPTYSYGPGASTDTMTDAAAFEQVLMENGVDLVVSGRLGWNGVYWTCAPGFHYPSPGSPHPDPNRPPGGLSQCAAASSELPDPSASLPAGDITPRPLPTVVAASAGGKFGRGGDIFGDHGPSSGSPAEGYWRGYTTVRIDPTSDAPPIVEQRPVFDWIEMEGTTHVLGAGEKTRVEGFGREPAGMDVPLRYAAIDSPAITHRYDLLLADQEKPWLPCMASDESCVALHSKLASKLSSRAKASRSDAAAEGSPSASATSTSLGSENPCDPYLCLPANVGTIDDQTGAIGAGNGKYPDTFAIAMLSVGERVATYPIAFTKSPSFVVQPLTLTPQTPQLPTTDTSAPSPPSPPNPPQPNVPQPNVPEIPAPPPVPPIAAASPPEPQPPAPPAPPPPTEQPSPLSLTLAPPSIAIATPTAVIQPPTPPVNPAPPGGARREARQRQAAAQKSGADNEEGSPEDRASETQGAGGDMANRPMGADMTRRDTAVDRHSFTALRRESPSESAQGLLYAGGLTIAAAALALGFNGVRPTPRRTPPVEPSPAWARARIRRR